MIRYTKKIAFLIFIIFMFSILPLYSENQKTNRKPDPYGVEEFKEWQKELRRFEIISFGALPFVSLLSFWGYDIIRSIQHKGDPAYNPWPLKNPANSVKLTEKEQLNVFLTAMGISIGIAIIDLSYRSIKKTFDNKKNINIKKEAIELIPVSKIEDLKNLNKVTKNEN